MALLEVFELRCSNVHPGGCDRVVRGPNMDDVLDDMELHGELAHRYSPEFYSLALPRMRVMLMEQAALTA